MLGDGYSQDQIDRSMRSKATHRIRFKQAVPTHLVYLTTWVSEDGALQFRPDIDRNDDKLLDALRASETLLAETVSDDKADSL